MGRRFLWKKQQQSSSSSSYMRLDGRRPDNNNHTTGYVFRLLHFLNYHHLNWHNVKRVLPHKKHHGVIATTTHPAGLGNTDHYHHNHEDDEITKQQVEQLNCSYEEKEISLSEVKSATSKTNSTRNKRSIRSRIRALLSEKDHDSNSKSKRVTMLPDSVTDNENSINFNSSFSVEESAAAAAKHNADFLEVFKVNKKIFLKILSDKDIAASLDEKRAFPTFNLTKSGSFPSLNSSSNNRFSSPTKLEDKHKEIWPQVKGIDISDIEILFESSTDNDNRRSEGNNVRRATSLNESSDGYAQLFDAILKKEMRKSLSSRSLKLGSDGEPIMSSRSLKLQGSEGESVMLTEPAVLRSYSRRRLSVSDIDYCSFLPGVISDAADRKSDACKSDADLAIKGKGFSSEVVDSETNQLTEVIIRTDLDKRCQDEVVGSFETHENPDLEVVVGTCVENNPASATEEGGPQDQSTSSSSSVDHNVEIPEETNHHEVEEEIQEVDENLKADFYYVKDVLDLLGLTRKDQLTTFTWHTYDQPLSPSLFEEIEATRYSSTIDQPRYSTSVKTFDAVNSRKFLFDLVNMALVDIDENSCVSYPKALSNSCHVPPMSKGGRNQVLNEVWASVVQCLEWKVESNASLDVIVGKDLYSGNDGWMNLQMESECVGLELEDIILDDLLDDIILSCYCQ